MQWSGVLHAHPLSFKATEQGFEMGLRRKPLSPSRRLKRGRGHRRPTNASVVHRHVPALMVRPKNFKPADALFPRKAIGRSVSIWLKAGGERLRAHRARYPYGFFEISDGAVVELEDRVFGATTLLLLRTSRSSMPVCGALPMRPIFQRAPR